MVNFVFFFSQGYYQVVFDECREVAPEFYLLLSRLFIEANVDPKHFSPADLVQTHKALVDLVRALHHALGVVHGVLLPVTQLGVAARLLHVAGLAYHHLAHFVNEKALLAGQ